MQEIEIRKQKSIYYLTTECMEQLKYYVKMDSTSMQEIFIFGLKWKKLLVVDNASTDKTINVKEKLKECETAIWMMPSGLTWEPQPLDISIIKCLKKM